MRISDWSSDVCSSDLHAAIFRALGPDGHVINIARGSIIDEAELIEALQNNVIAGAGLDVFEHEPQVPEALRQLENRSEEHTSELQSLMRISYAVLCLKKKITIKLTQNITRLINQIAQKRS